MNVALNVFFFIETNNLIVFFYLGYTDQKMYFLNKRSLAIVNEGSPLTVVNCS